MASKRSRKMKRSSRRTKARKGTRGTMRSFSALAPPRYEKKFLDTNLSAALGEFATGGVVQATYCVMASGAGNGQRIGNRITVTNINAHLNIMSGISNSNPGMNNTIVRVILGIDKQANGAAPDVGDVLQTASPYSFRNMYTLNRFVILKDKLLALNPQASDASYTGQHSRVLKFSWKGQLPVLYSDTTASIGVIESNNIFMLVIADRAATAAQLDGAFGTVRIKYTDA